jgi:hypothetical protein
MGDILENITRYVSNPTPNQFTRRIEKVLREVDEMEMFIQQNVNISKHEKAVLKYTQQIRMGAVTALEVFQSYVDAELKDQERMNRK